MKPITTLFLLLAFALNVHSQIFNAGFENNNGTPLSSFSTVNNDGLTVPIFAPIQEFNTEAWIQFYDGYDNKIAFSTSLYDPSGQSDDWLITPAIEIPTEGNPTMYWKAKSYDFEFTDNYEVRVSTTNNDIASFTDLLLTVTGEQPFEYNSRNLDLSAYQGETIYIAFVNTTYDGYYLALDGLYISNSTGCILPDITGINISNLTEDSFSVEWTATSNITSYDTGLTTFTVPVASTGAQTELSKTYSNLEPATRYQFFLKNNDCGSGWTTPTSIWTAAIPPYSYGFEVTEENYGEYDSDGWSSTTWLNGTGPNAQEGLGYIFNNTSTSFPKNDWIYSYPIRLQAGETLTIKYYVQLGSETADDAIIKIAAANSPSVDANIEELDTYTISGGEYEERSSEFTPTETGTYYFGFGNVTPIVSESAALRLDNIRFTSENLSIENQNLHSIKIFPNPVKNHLSIISKEDITGLELYSVNGKLLDYPKNTNNIDFTPYPNGIYFLKIITPAGSSVEKIIK